jgi:predicted house-cleaning noncanonical NTP pyrophosphatase (MazG superfamily)
MNNQVYNKLVRDNIIEIIQNEGKTVKYRNYSDKEFIDALNIKLKEEVNEFVENNEIEELADVFEVIEKIMEIKEININNINDVKRQKTLIKGKFDKKICLISVQTS